MLQDYHNSQNILVERDTDVLKEKGVSVSVMVLQPMYAREVTMQLQHARGEASAGARDFVSHQGRCQGRCQPSGDGSELMALQEPIHNTVNRT